MEVIQGSVLSRLNWKGTSADNEESFARVNWDAIGRYALGLRRQHTSNLSDRLKLLPQCTQGGLHLVRLLEFDDGIRWLARVQNDQYASKSAGLQHEVYTMKLVRERTEIPVPRVFGYEPDANNESGVAFILMEFLPGNTAMDANGGWDTHHGEIPEIYKPKFYRAVAQIQVKMASIRFSKIGSIIRYENGEYDIGPLPYLGGPFESATAFFQAWANKAKFPFSESQIRKMLPNGLADEVLSSIQSFPSLIRSLAGRLSRNDDGPFPLYHPDFYHSNIIVDASFNILGVIDWEGASTVPWELVAFPLFLSTTPPPMDTPWNYDEGGEPRDAGTKLRWQERKEYVESIRKAEFDMKADDKLSTTLADHSLQNLATAMKLYLDPGKMGFYHKILQPFKEQKGK